MGLDIFIETSAEEKEEPKSCHGISREFCFQICELAKNNRETELIQTYNLYEMDYEILSKANVWNLEEKLRYDETCDLSQKEIEMHYEMAFQPSQELLKNLKTLYRNIEKHPELLKKVKQRKSGRDDYFEEFSKNVGKYIVDKNFGWDLRTMIDFLEELQEGDKVRFGFV